MENPNDEFWRERLKILRSLKEDEKDHVDTILENILSLKDYISEKSPGYDNSFSQKFAILLLAEKVSVGGIKQEYLNVISNANLIMIHEYDLFAHGYTAFKAITMQEVLEIWEYFILDPDYGCEAWICNNEKRLPTPRKNFFNKPNSDWSYVPSVNNEKLDIEYVLFRGNPVPEAKKEDNEWR